MKVMNFLWILSVGLLYAGAGKAQLPQLERCIYTVATQNTPDGFPFVAVQDVKGNAEGGQVRFNAGSPGWVYKWKFNGTEYDGTSAADSSFSVFPLRGNGVYSVVAEKEGKDTTSGDFRIFYVHVPEFGLSIVEETRYNCDGIELKIDSFRPAEYVYGEDVRYYGNRSVEYLLSTRKDPIVSPDYWSEGMKIYQTVNEQNARYTITVKDKFGFDWTSKEVEYISVIPKAKMSFKLLNTVKVDGYGEDMGQAPLEVEFKDESVNAQAYDWYLYKDTADLKGRLPMLEDSLMDRTVRHDPEFAFTYEHTGLYGVRLKVINTVGQNHCWDTTEMKDIRVIASLVNVPNVFTPNGDGINDIFRVQMLSVTSFHAIIINRWGRKVYEWSDPEGGWDGKINGTEASPGTYYYIVTARGLEKNNPPKHVKKGALLLVR